MTKCPHCSSEINPNWFICPQCKKALGSLGEDPLFTPPRAPGTRRVERKQKHTTVADLVQAGDIINHRYKVLSLLGEGGVGTVYKVLHLSMPGKKHFALKILHPQFSEDPVFRKRFMREVQVAMEFVHEHAVQIREFGETDEGWQYFTMDYSDGVCLRDYFLEEYPLAEKKALRITKQVLSALSGGHNKGIIHRDLKPENIIIETINGKEFAKVLDFGVAKILTQDLEKLTRENIILGTPNYMSPEQIRNLQLDPRSDIYTMGIILYEMLVGELPFDGDVKTIFQGHLFEIPKSPRLHYSDITINADQITNKALEKSPEDRFVDVEEFIEAIDQALCLPTKRKEINERLQGAKDYFLKTLNWIAPKMATQYERDIRLAKNEHDLDRIGEKIHQEMQQIRLAIENE